MSEYNLKIQQIVDYPRCRVYREFVQTLIADRNIRVNGCSGLFHYTVLCSYANFRTSYRRLDGISYTVYPGEWICRISELQESLRLRTRRQVIQALNRLQDQHLIQFNELGRGHLIKYRIVGWRRHNTVLDYNCPCQKDTGFFFLPISTAMELVGIGKCSEMDIVLDLWFSAVYNDTQVQGSFAGPVAYFRNGSGRPLVSYSYLALRWGISKASVGRILNKMKRLGYIALMTFPGRHGTAIYLKNYLSTMFQISDVMIDKDEVAMSLNIRIPVTDEPDTDCEEVHSSISNEPVIVSKSILDLIAAKVLNFLDLQGIACSRCPKSQYKLYPLCDDCEGSLDVESNEDQQHRFRMEIFCSHNAPVYTFELSLRSSDNRGGKQNG